MMLLEIVLRMVISTLYVWHKYKVSMTSGITLTPNYILHYPLKKNNYWNNAGVRFISIFIIIECFCAIVQIQTVSNITVGI